MAYIKKFEDFVLENKKINILPALKNNLRKLKRDLPNEYEKIFEFFPFSIKTYRGGGDSELMYFTPEYKYAKWFGKANNTDVQTAYLDKRKFLDLREVGNYCSIEKVEKCLRAQGGFDIKVIEDNLGKMKCYVWKLIGAIFESNPTLNAILFRENNPEARNLGTVDTYVFRKNADVCITSRMIYNEFIKGKNTELVNFLNNLFPKNWELKFPHTMPKELRDYILSWNKIVKSPYSDSYYDTDGKTWTHTPDDSMRVSDHWNFTTNSVINCPTDIQVPTKKWAIGKFDKTDGLYHILKIYDSV